LKSIQFEYKKYYRDDIIHDEVTNISSTTITTVSGQIYTPDYIIIATGSRSNTFGNKHIEQYGYTFRFASDIEKLNKNLPQAGSVTVVGGGYTGIEIICNLAQKYPTKKLRIIHGSDRLLNNYSQHISDTTTHWLTKRGVEIICNEKVSDIIENTVSTQSGKIFESDITIFSAGIAINDESFRGNLCFLNQYNALEGNHIYLCGDVACHGLASTAHNAMIEGRRIGNFIADHITDTHKIYTPLQNWIILALAMGTRDGMITNGPKGFFVPYIIGFCKRVVERRCMFEFKRKIMLWV
jgi:NADH dehydrogenase FAD-containing subunit